jgi:hypothetical protein
MERPEPRTGATMPAMLNRHLMGIVFLVAAVAFCLAIGSPSRLMSSILCATMIYEAITEISYQTKG